VALVGLLASLGPSFLLPRVGLNPDTPGTKRPIKPYSYSADHPGLSIKIAFTLYRLESIFRDVATEVIVTAEFAAWYEGLSLTEQNSVGRVVGLLEERGPTLEFPFSSGIKGSSFSGMRELRIQHAGDPYRVLYAFDPIRQAILLVGGVKTGKGKRWYEEAIRLADKLFAEYLRGE
jgi:hypothetical protein